MGKDGVKSSTDQNVKGGDSNRGWEVKSGELLVWRTKWTLWRLIRKEGEEWTEIAKDGGFKSQPC